MDKIMVHAAFFSPTGTTEKVVRTVAKSIGKSIGAGLNVFDFTLPSVRDYAKEFTLNDIVVVGVPVYAGRVPNVLKKYLNTFVGGGAKAVPIVLFGNRNYDDALIELRDILQACSFDTIAGGAFVGEHAFSKKLAQGRPDHKDMTIAEDFGKKIGHKLKNNSYSSPITVKGETPIRPYYQPKDGQGNAIDIRKVRSLVSSECTDCGICANVCPMGSIDNENVRQYNNICIKCGACIKRCPYGARYYVDEGYLYHVKDLEETYKRRAEPEIFI